MKQNMEINIVVIVSYYAYSKKNLAAYTARFFEGGAFIIRQRLLLLLVC